MAILLGVIPPPGVIAGRQPVRFSGLGRLSGPQTLQQDFRFSLSTLGEIRDRAMFKTSPSAPEVPMPLARIWVQRLVDGRRAWEGFSDALGYYHATGLEVGVAYVVIGIDTAGEHKCTAGGPVTAKVA
ncbi:MAG: hypothetical protein RSD57_14500 [Comamonas sp.]